MADEDLFVDEDGNEYVMEEVEVEEEEGATPDPDEPVEEDDLATVLGVDGVEEEEDEDDPDLSDILDSDDKDDEEDDTTIIDEVEKEIEGEPVEGELLLPEGFEEMAPQEQDEELALLLEDDKTWEDWRTSSKEVIGEPDRGFAVAALKAGLTPEYLSKNGIYTMKHFSDRIDALAAQTDDDAIVIKDPESEEEWTAFYEEHLGIPRDKEGYDQNVFKGTPFESDEKAREFYLERAVRNNYSQGQLEDQVTEAVEIAQEEKRRGREELKQYQKTETEKLEKYFPKASKEVLKENVKVLKSTSAGRELLDKFRGDKMLFSAEFHSTLHQLLNYKQSSRDLSLLIGQSKAKLDIAKADLSGFKLDQLASQRDKLMGSKIAQEENLHSANPKKVAAHKKVWKAIDRLEGEIAGR